MKHLRPVPDTSVNDLSRRVMLQQTVAAMLPHEPKWAMSDGDRLALLTERLGDVAAAYGRGHTSVEDELLKVWATCQCWLEARSRDSAA